MKKILRIGLGLIAVLWLNVNLVAATSGAEGTPNAQSGLPGNVPAASTSADGVWSDVNEVTLSPQTRAQRTLVPLKYRTLAANLATLDQLLAQTRDGAVVLTLPLPDGRFGKFRVEVFALMAPAIAAQFSNIQTYRGFGIDDPTATVSLDRTPAGFHAMILSASDSVFVDPYSTSSSAYYISYAKGDYVSTKATLFRDLAPLTIPNRTAPALRAPRANSTGTSLRQYRLAIAAASSYTAVFGTQALAYAAIITTVTRVRGIYNREFAIDFQLVSGTNTIYDNPATDPYNGKTPEEALPINQTNLDAVVGSSNYDIGHAFIVGAGGLGAMGVVCDSAWKARGITGTSNPQGDPFDVDFVAHEIGHQFNADHTFNGIVTGDSSCSTSNRAGGVAYEPGAATTIMGYAGTCAAQNITNSADDYFHSANFDQVIQFTTDVTTGGSCGTQLAASNQVPVVNAGANYTIPKQTPFTLTGSATDGDGDALTYGWEEFDLGAQFTSTSNGNLQFGLPNTDADGQARPIFRTLPATTSPARTFPNLATILNNAANYTNLGESLPTINRTMKFRLTARDNKGGVANALTTITISEAGPFRVTYPITAEVTWTGNSSQAVAWNVATTNIAPVSCANVNIQLSQDGGNTFSTTLANNVPNNGSATITAPNVTTTSARVRVGCADNIFFDISRANFAISAGPGGGSKVYLPYIQR